LSKPIHTTRFAEIAREIQQLRFDADAIGEIGITFY